jgi:hypothetical protein
MVDSENHVYLTTDMNEPAIVFQGPEGQMYIEGHFTCKPLYKGEILHTQHTSNTHKHLYSSNVCSLPALYPRQKIHNLVRYPSSDNV